MRLNILAGQEMQFCHMILGEYIWTQSLAEALPKHPKIVKAIRRLLNRAGDTILDGTPVTLKVMGRDEMGFALPAQLTNRSDEPASMIVLSPLLEKASQRVVDYTVAHEFAHVLTEEEAKQLEYAVCENCEDENGCPDDCPCEAAETHAKCQACRDADYNFSAHASPEDYVLSPAERIADDTVIAWGFRIPPWKEEIRQRYRQGEI